MESFVEKKYSLFDEPLKKISRNINFRDEEKEKHLWAFREVFEEFRKKIMEEQPFFTLFKKHSFSGSHANGTKIGDADEFDMMICMKLPKELDVEIKNSPHAAYIQIKTSGVEALKIKPNYEEKYKCIEKWLDDKNYILQNKFRRWFESMIQKILNGLDKNILKCGYNEYHLTFQKSNPAFCLNVRSCSNGAVKFDVDLVPNFYFEHPTWPPICKQKIAAKYTPKEWFVIAKRVAGEEDNRHWRVVFLEQEKEILRGTNNLKSTLRFMKQLRDKHQMPGLKSYYITTVFLWQADLQPSNFWDKRLSFLFMHMLQKLRDCVERKKIPYFWYSQLNLMENVKHEILDDYLRKIDNIFRAIERYYPINPEIITNILVHGLNKLTCENLSFQLDQMNLNSEEGQGYSNNQSLLPWSQNSSLQYREQEDEDEESSNYSGRMSQNQMERNDQSNIVGDIALAAAAAGAVLAGLWAYRKYSERN